MEKVRLSVIIGYADGAELVPDVVML